MKIVIDVTDQEILTTFMKYCDDCGAPYIGSHFTGCSSNNNFSFEDKFINDFYAKIMNGVKQVISIPKVL